MKLIGSITAGVFAAGLAAVALAAAAQTAPDASSTSAAAPASTPAASPKKKDPADRVICKEAAPSGTRIPGPSVCHTKREWDQMSQSAATKYNNPVSTQGSMYGPHY